MEAQIRVYRAYVDGDGVDKNAAEAEKWRKIVKKECGIDASLLEPFGAWKDL